MPFPDEGEGSNQLINNSVYLSTDNTFGGGDTPHWLSRRYRPSPRVDRRCLVSAGPSTVTIPANTAAGTYILFIVADDGSQSVTGEVNELNENNNASPAAVVHRDAVVNVAPIASDQSVATNEDTATPITLAASDANNDALNFSIVAGPSHGTLSGTAPNVTYTPAANYFGADSFTFKANDGSLDSNVATVSITVNAVNDAPVANNQNKTVVENTATPITLTAGDVDSAILTYSIVAQPTHGTLSGTAPNVTYTPQMNYEGADSFTFRVSDGSRTSDATVSITVTPGIDQYGFNGLLSPYQAPPRFGNLGSAQPMAWQ